jgi:hypothetical protein
MFGSGVQKPVPENGTQKLHIREGDFLLACHQLGGMADLDFLTLIAE